MGSPAWLRLILQICSASLTWAHPVSLRPSPDSPQQIHPFLLNAADAGKPSHTGSGKHIYFSTVPYMCLLSRKKKKNSYKPKLLLRSHDYTLIKLLSMKRTGAFCEVINVYHSVFNSCSTKSSILGVPYSAFGYEARLWWNWTLFPSYLNRAAAFIFPVNFESQFCKCGAIKYVQD